LAILQTGKDTVDDRFPLSISVQAQKERSILTVDLNIAGGIKKQARKSSTHYVENSRFTDKGATAMQILDKIRVKIATRVASDKDLLRMYTNIFRKADLLDRGEITIGQLNIFFRRFFAINLDEKQTSDLFAYLDVNGDKAVSRVEFIQGFLGHRGFDDTHVRLRAAAAKPVVSARVSARPSTGSSVRSGTAEQVRDGGSNTWSPPPDFFFSKLASAATNLAAAAGVKPRLFLLEKLASMGCRDRLSMNDIRQLLMDWGVNTMSLGKIATALSTGECYASDGAVRGEYAWEMGKLHVKVVDTHLMLGLVERQLRYCTPAALPPPPRMMAAAESSSLPILTKPLLMPFNGSHQAQQSQPLLPLTRPMPSIDADTFKPASRPSTSSGQPRLQGIMNGPNTTLFPFSPIKTVPVKAAARRSRPKTAARLSRPSTALPSTQRGWWDVAEDRPGGRAARRASQQAAASAHP
jgi:hypothetical protein